MTISASEIKNKLERILPYVQKPGRYTGGELNQVLKNWENVNTHVALVFPDLYDLGMSNLGLAILYDELNQQQDVLAERSFTPWTDMEGQMREKGVPLYSLESKHALIDFDLVGFSLPYETLYTNTLNALDLAGIPLRSDERNEFHPIIIAGGHATYNPEPMHAFIDAFLIGDGEKVVQEIVEVYQKCKQSNLSRQEILKALSQIWGVYVPALYQAYYHQDGVFSHIEKVWEEAPNPIRKHIIPKLPTPVTKMIVPYIDTVHNRVPIEIMRGCTRGCRFCHAGMVNRPVRERSVEEIIQAIDEALANTGYEEVGLLSLSSSDYRQILELVEKVSAHFEGRDLRVSLPSLRIESFSADLMDALKDSRRSGFTLAPEAATEHMRKIINKPVSTEQLLETTRAIFDRGWHNIKLYFMIGHPSETMDDVLAIVNVCKAVLAEGKRIIGNRAQVTASVSNFVPKPHTPFQWVACDSIEIIEAKIQLLKQNLRGRGLKLKWNSPQETMLEAWLSRGDRRMAEVIYTAWKSGAKFEAWKEYFNYDLWMNAFNINELDPSFYTQRERSLDESYPWDHISTGVDKRYIKQEYQWSLEGKTRPDCRNHCYACGILPNFNNLRRQNPGDFWLCPEVNHTKSSNLETKTIPDPS